MDLTDLLDPRRTLGLAGLAPAAMAGVARSRLSPPLSPVANASLLSALSDWGTTPALGYASGAARHPDAIAVVDPSDAELPEVTFAEVEQRTRAAAYGLKEQGIGPGVSVGLLARNSRAMAEAMAAVARTGASLYYLNTGFTAEQIRILAQREGMSRFIVDRDLADRVPDPRILLQGPGNWWSLAGGPPRPVGRPRRPGRHVILTSGTTGVPKGAARDAAPIEAAISALDAFPFTQRDTHVMAAPLFHAWGWLQHRLCAIFDSTEVMVRKLDPLHILRLAAEHGAEVIITIPVIVQRMADLPAEATADLDLSRLRMVAYSGAPVPAPVVGGFQDRFGDVLYNLYGSTEAAFATIAGPADLRADPGTAGRPIAGVRVRVVDADGELCPPGVSGRVYVGSSASFEGYTDGADRTRLDGLVDTGDLGLIDEDGRLKIIGRVDDVIVSGGENVHPVEVESVLRRHPAVADVAVVGVPDDTFGNRVVAHVVLGDHDGSDEDAVDGLLAWGREQLAGYQRPRQIVLHDELPRNATGKLLRRELG